MIKTLYPESELFGGHPNPQEVCDNIKKGMLYVYCLKKGKQVYDFIPFDDQEISTLFGNVSVVKYGRHWWI
jgi:hypothetical protein